MQDNKGSKSKKGGKRDENQGSKGGRAGQNDRDRSRDQQGNTDLPSFKDQDTEEGEWPIE